MTKTMELDVNGAAHAVTTEENTPLVYILRNDLKLKGTRVGCGQGVCGSCTVLMDGRSIQSCNTPVSAAVGHEITTIEGLAQTGGAAGALHPLQQAFIDEQAGQCGYCLTGIIMRAAALLHLNPAPTDDEITSGLDMHLCRCGSYERILRAIKRASRQMTSNRAG